MSEKCPFCEIDPGRIVASNDLALAITDAFPVTPGHILVIPRRHVASWFDATEEEQIAIMQLMNQLQGSCVGPPKQGKSPDAFNIGINIGAAAGQTVMHLHVHLIPRYAGDQEDPRGGVRWIFPDRAKYWT